MLERFFHSGVVFLTVMGLMSYSVPTVPMVTIPTTPVASYQLGYGEMLKMQIDRSITRHRVGK